MALVDELREFINLTHALAWDRAKNLNTIPDEPGLVASFLDSTLQAQLQSILAAHYTAGKSLNMQLSSVFTHKTPVIKPVGAANGVEIADLLLIRQHFAKGKETAATTGRALLLQAKRNSTPSSGNVASGNSLIQFDLYKSWPDFEGVSRLPKAPPGALNWSFSPPAGTQSGYGHYLAVYDGQAFDWTPGPPPAMTPTLNSLFPSSGYPPSTAPSTTWANGPVLPNDTASNGVACTDDFAITLERFINGAAGEFFQPGVHSGQDHWSVFVNRMLMIAAQRNYTYTSKRTGVPSGTARSRNVSAFAAVKPYLAFEIQAGLQSLIPSSAWAHLDSRLYLEDWFLLRHLLAPYTPSFEFISDLHDFLRYAPRGGEPPPELRDTESNPFDDGGHLPVLVLATTSDEMLDELR